MSRTLREYEPGLSSCMKGSRRFKGVKRNGVVVGSDGMVATKAESEWDRQYKKHASRLERRTAKTEMARAVAWIIWNMAMMLLAVCSLPLFIILVVWLDKWLDKM